MCFHFDTVIINRHTASAETESRKKRFHMRENTASEKQAASCHRRGKHQRTALYSVAYHLMSRTEKTLYALYFYHTAACAFYFSSAAFKKCRQIFYFRLACRSAYHGTALRQHRRTDSIFRSPYAWKRKLYFGSFKSSRRCFAHYLFILASYFRSKRFKHRNVHIYRTHAYTAASGSVYLSSPKTRNKRSCHKYG